MPSCLSTLPSLLVIVSLAKPVVETIRVPACPVKSSVSPPSPVSLVSSTAPKSSVAAPDPSPSLKTSLPPSPLILAVPLQSATVIVLAPVPPPSSASSIPLSAIDSVPSTSSSSLRFTLWLPLAVATTVSPVPAPPSITQVERVENVWRMMVSFRSPPSRVYVPAPVVAAATVIVSAPPPALTVTLPLKPESPSDSMPSVSAPPPRLMVSVVGIANDVVSIAPLVLRTWISPAVGESSRTQPSSPRPPLKITFAAVPPATGSRPAYVITSPSRSTYPESGPVGVNMRVS